MIDVVEALKAGKTLAELAKAIGAEINKAFANPDAVPRVLLYLDAARAAVQSLGFERQQILTAMRRVDLRDGAAVEVLWLRLDSYLHEDRIRPQLEAAIGGLEGCRPVIEKQSSGLVWRKADKQAALSSFVATLNRLDNLLGKLVSNFLPGRSGMGVQTLREPDELLTKLRDHYRHGRATGAVAAQERLGELVRIALADSSNEEWVRFAGEVEGLIAELRYAFNHEG